MDFEYDPKLVDAITNTVGGWESARVSGNDLVFWDNGNLFCIPLRRSRNAPLLQRITPTWMSMHHVYADRDAGSR